MTEHISVCLSLLSVYPSRNGGTATYARGLISALGSCDGVDVNVLVNSEAHRYFADLRSAHVDIRRLPSYDTTEHRLGRVPALVAAHALKRVGRPLSRSESDVVHYAQTVMAPRVSLPSVVTLHDALHHEHPEFFSPAVRLWRRLVYDTAARRAHLVVTDSDHARQQIINHLELNPGRVRVAYLGVDGERFTPVANAEDDTALKHLGVTFPYLLYPAAFLPHKNHRNLFRALALTSDIHLVLTGPHFGRKATITNMAGREGVESRVHHLGLVPADALPALYRRAAALVFPSLYEGFGAPVLEAMASGCPVASSTASSLREVAGDAAVPLDPTDATSIASAITTVISDEARRRVCITRGLDRVSRFTWASCARKHAAVYREARNSFQARAA